jgi:carbamoyl-phosphate synthase small subunit
MNAKLILEDGTIFSGRAFGWTGSVAGEVVFNTGMVGYPECFTDPSYKGQILVLTYPLIGNYGVPSERSMGGISSYFESNQIQISALIVAEYSAHFSHWSSSVSLDHWLQAQKIPGIAGIDTRLLTQKLRNAGSMLGKVIYENRDVEFYDPNRVNLVAQVSIERPIHYGDGSALRSPEKRDKKHVAVVDCGCKNNIIRSLLQRGLSVTAVPWDWPLENERFDGVVLSNGPGDPKTCDATVKTVRRLLEKNAPVFGICLGSQILALAAGAETYKLKYGHRGQNQPCVLVGSKRCFITSQNHGYAVNEETLPPDWQPWFFNANDGTNEGIRHRTKPFMGVQFHPEASPGPVDTAFLFDEFVKLLRT